MGGDPKAPRRAKDAAMSSTATSLPPGMTGWLPRVMCSSRSRLLSRLRDTRWKRVRPGGSWTKRAGADLLPTEHERRIDPGGPDGRQQGGGERDRHEDGH